jgi:hypothetical protein
MERTEPFSLESYEGFRLSSASQTLLLVPTPAQLAGDFRGVLAKGVQLYDLHSLSRIPFVGNQIAAALTRAWLSSISTRGAVSEFAQSGGIWISIDYASSLRELETFVTF